MTQERKLIKKLSEVMLAVKYIQKRGKNTFHKYTFATESDVAEHVREELAKRFVMMIPNVVDSSIREHKNRSGNTEYIIKVRMEFKFIDGETGEEISFHTEGEGQDAGDKGIYKAMTGAQKYALMKAFMIPTGDDPEADNTVDERNEGKIKEVDKKNGKKIEPPPMQTKPPIKADTIGLIKVLAGNIAEKRNTDVLDSYNILLKRTDFAISELETWSEEEGKNFIEVLERWIKKLDAK